MTSQPVSAGRSGRWLAAARWLLLGAAALVPLAAGYVPFAGRPGIFMSHTTIPAQSAALGLLVGAASVCWAVALLRGEVRLKRIPYGWLLSVFLLLVVTSTATALDRTVAVFGNEYGEQGLLTIAAYTAAFLLATQVVEGRAQLLRIAQAVALSGAAVALFGVLQSLGLPYFPLPQESFLDARGTSTLGNPDMLGTFLIIPLTISLGLSIATPGARRWLWRVAAVVTAASLLMTQTRGAWLGALCAVVVLGVVVYRSPRQGSSALARWAVPGLVVLVGIGVAVYKAATGVEPLLYRLTQGGAGADGGRLLVWSEALKVVGRYPLLGAGPDNFLYGWYQVATSAQVRLMGIDGVINEAHNYWLGTAVSSGVLAAVLLILFVARVVAGSRGVVITRPDAPLSPDRMAYAALWAGVAGLCVALVFSVVLTPIGLLLWLALGLLVLPKVRPLDESAARGRVPIGVAAVSVLLGLSLVGWGAATGLSSTVEHVRDGSGRDRLQAARTASRIAPWRQYPLFLEAQVLEQNGATPGEILPVIDRLIALTPRGYEYYRIRARLLGSQPDQVIATADRGLAAYPAGLRLIAQRALAEAMSGDVVPAEREAAAAWRIARDVIPAYREPSVGITYAQILGAQGKDAEAKKVLDDLQATFPGNADVKKLQSLITSSTP